MFKATSWAKLHPCEVLRGHITCPKRQSSDASVALDHSAVLLPQIAVLPIQEESLKQWILSMDQCGMPPRIATVRQMASIIAGWGGPLACVGHWLVDHVINYEVSETKRRQFKASHRLDYHNAAVRSDFCDELNECID